jgi:hypothetical protein
MMQISKILLAGAASVLLLSGCATTSQLDEVRAQAVRAQQTADAPKRSRLSLIHLRGFGSAGREVRRRGGKPHEGRQARESQANSAAWQASEGRGYPGQ